MSTTRARLVPQACKDPPRQVGASQPRHSLEHPLAANTGYFGDIALTHQLVPAQLSRYELQRTSFTLNGAGLLRSTKQPPSKGLDATRSAGHFDSYLGVVMKTPHTQRKETLMRAADGDGKQRGYKRASVQMIAIATLVTGSALLGTVPAQAAAATGVGVSGGVLNVNAAPGAANRITISQSGGSFVIRDGGGAIGAGSACTSYPIFGLVVCPSSGVSKVSVHLGDRNDTLSVNFSGPVEAFGDDGDDVLVTGSGDDILDGGKGADKINGGAGKDTVDYGTRNTALQVRLDGSANSGESGENDTIGADVENIEGGSGGDTLIGNDQGNRIRGYGGNDDIKGQGGKDSLTGGDDNDQVDGGPGDDTLAGSNDNDIVTGGPGNDVIKGNSGNDKLNGQDGVEKNDTLDGGNQTDTCAADLLDTKTACEN